MTRAESTVQRRRGRFRTPLVLLLTLALVFCCGILPGRAQAASSSMTVVVEQPPNNKFAADTSTEIILGSDGIFKVTGATGVRAVRVVVSRGSSSGVNMKVDKASSWKASSTSSSSFFTLGNKNGNLTSNEINTNLSLLLASFIKTASRESVTFEVSIKFSSNPNAMNSTTDNALNDALYGWENKKTTEISFIPFATGSTVLSNVSYSVDNKVNGTEQNLIVPVSEGARASLSISLDNLGGASNVIYGFRYKESTSASWINGKTVVDNNNIIDIISSTKPPIKRSLETGAIFKAGVSYDVQGVIITNGQSGFPKFTNTVQVRYDKPVVNSFNVGATTGSIFKGGEDSKNLSLLATFNNTNYDGMTEAKEIQIGDQYYPLLGPVLAVSAHFTRDYKIGTVTGADGVERQVDNSVWTAVPNDANTNPAEAGKTMWLLTVPKASRSVNLDWLVAKLPAIDSQTAAYKVTVMDPYSGYTASMVSEQFTIDSSAPPAPTVSNRDDPDHPLGPGDGETAIVGGKDSKVTLNITGSDELVGSGLQAYQYSIYYISTADGDKLVAGAPDRSTQAILRTMKEFTYTENSNPVYNGVTATLTPWTTLQLESENGVMFSTVAVSKDGYYRVDARATDRAGRNSNVTTTLFRVDLSVPNTPIARVSTQIDGAYAAYDNNIYSDMETWALVQVPAMTGKTVDTIQYSTDGGLSWKDAWTGDTLPAGQSAQVYQMAKGEDGSPNGNTDKNKESFSYQVGVKLVGTNSLALTGYQSVLFRAVDTLGNSSLASNPVAVRTSSRVVGSASLRHEGIEVALSMGNTMLQTSNLTADLKNATAQKINLQYFGGSASDLANAPDAVKAMVGANGKLHSCTWADSMTCEGACLSGANCPYVKYANQYDYFTPQMVNVQGIANADASNQSQFKWTRYDHTFYKEVNGKQIPTVGYVYHTDANSEVYTATDADPNIGVPGRADYIYTEHSVTQKITTNLAGPEGAYDGGNGLYTQSNSRVTWLYQDKTVDEDGNIPDTSVPENALKNGAQTGASYLARYMTYANNTGVMSNTAGTGGFQDYMPELYPTQTYFWLGNNIQRIYHVFDISDRGENLTIGNITATSANATAVENNTNAMQKIGTAGSYRSAARDFLFLYNDQPAKKTIFFTVDDTFCVSHAADGYGFLFNTTIRQGIDFEGEKSWRISGYMFFCGTQSSRRFVSDNPANDSNGKAVLTPVLVDTNGDGLGDTTMPMKVGAPEWQISEQMNGLKWYMLRIDDVNLEHFCDMTIRGGIGAGNSGVATRTNPGKSYSLETAPGYTWGKASPDGAVGALDRCLYDDLMKYLVWIAPESMGRNPISGKGEAASSGNSWIASDTPWDTYYDPVTRKMTYDRGVSYDANGNSTDPVLVGDVRQNPLSEGLDFGIDLIARREYDIPTTNSAANKYIRNYVLQLEGNNTTIYCYNSGKANVLTSKISLEDEKDASGAVITKGLKTRFAEQVTADTPYGVGNFAAGYTAVDWLGASKDSPDPTNTPDNVVIDWVLTAKGWGNATAQEEFKRDYYKNSFLGMDVRTYYTDEDGNPTDVNPYVLKTVRPSVNGIQIGSQEARDQDIYTDSSCYGFGPISSNRAYSHACGADTRVEFSNISMSIGVARKLSEVVTEPQWGEGKAKYIVNLSDDSVEDFNDAVLSAQIQWRLFNDNARYVGWGSYYNEQQTMDFLKRIDGEGTFISTEDGTGNEVQKYRSQVNDIADYVANIYYDEFGLDTEQSIPGQVEHTVTGAVQAYNLDDVQNWKFSVTPKEYNTSTANADYPSGRWYIVHDTNGYGSSVSQISRSGQFSDALDLSITEAGRYMIYFAPRMEDVKNGTLDPATAVFNVVVNQTPRAQFTGALTDGGTIVGLSENISYDPDSLGLENEEPRGTEYSYAYTDSAGVKHENMPYNDVQLNGIAKQEWRWSIIKTEDKSLTTLLSTNWSEDSPKGKTLAELSNPSDLFGNFVSSGDVETVKPSQQFTNMPDNSVMTVYLRVHDTVTVLEALQDSSGKFAGYRYVPCGSKVSKVIQQNLTTSSGQVTYAPLSSFSLSTVSVYDTAMTAAGTAAPTVTRRSSDSQGYATEVQWALSVGGSYINMKRIPHQPNNPDTAETATIVNINDPGTPGADNAVSMNNGLTDWYIYLQGNANQKNWKGISWNPEKTDTLVDGTWYKVLSGVQPEYWEDSTASGMGTWEISKKFVDTFLPKGDKLVLQITERLWGLAVGDAELSWVTDSSARALYYKQDELAPSAQTVTVKTMVKQSDGTYKEETYAASNYLDVTDDDKYIRIEITGSKDAEGSLAGYGYYFYKKDAAGKIIPNSHSWFDPASKSWVNLNEGYKAITVGSDGQPMSNTNNSAVLEVKRDMMVDGSTPQQSFHLAIWAYDNQTSMMTLTHANQSAATAVEDIKLSRSKPMPPEITVTNAVSQKTAHIGNDNGYSGLTGSNDKQTGTANYASNTPVTVSFKPRQDKYSLNTSTNQLVKDPNGTSYYEDIFKAADLTNSAMMHYSVEYKAPPAKEESPWVPYESGDIPAVNIRTFSADGRYRVHAQVVNGVGRMSEERIVEFLVDKTPPSAPQVDFTANKVDYVPGTSGWAQEITYQISGGQDEFSAQSQTSRWIFMDSDKGWQRLGDLTSDYKETITATGNYTVRVKSVDQAGNETEAGPYSLKVDSQGPSLPKPVAQADAKSTRVYSEQVVFTKVTPDATRGIIQHIDKNSGVALNDTAVTVNLNESTKQFRLTANAGYTLTELWVGPVNGKLDNVMASVTKGGNNVWSYTMPVGTLTSDQSLQAVFKTQAEIDQGTSRQKSRLLQAEPMEPEARVGTNVATVTLKTSGDSWQGVGDSWQSSGSCVIQLDGVSAFPAEAGIGTTPTLSLTPSQGTRLNALKVGETNIVVENMDYVNGTYTCVLPEITGDVTIKVNYTQLPLHTVTLESKRWGTIEATGGYASKNGNVYKVYEGDTLTVQMTPSGGEGGNWYKLEKLLVDTNATGSVSTTQLIKITKDTTVEAVFTSFFGSYAWIPVHFNVEGGMVTPNGLNNDDEEHPNCAQVGMLAGQTFIITPKYGYHIETVEIKWYDTISSPAKEVLVTSVDQLTQIVNSDNSISYSYTIGKVVSNAESVKVTFAENRYNINTFTGDAGGGKITTDYTGDLTSVRQDEKLNFTITPDEGYKLTALKVNGVSVGAVNSYSLTAIQNYELSAVFEPKAVKETVTTHSITVQANNVSDAQDRLADQPYSFRLGDTGTWSSYQESSRYTFTGLEPNRKYKVSVRAKDAVGNVTETFLEIYTLANVPGVASVSAKNDTDNSESKSVLVEILPNGNPAGTKYMVYYSGRKSMEDAQSTGEWKLPSNGFIEVKNLEAGKRYYLQVAASNQDSVESGVDESSIGDILLTPTAPPANSMYVEDQTEPGGGIKIYWDTPQSENVTHVVIYRDGAQIAMRSAKEENSFVDTNNIRSDAVYLYSYAYYNAAGLGSARSAVSKSYYNAVKAAAAGVPANKTALDAIISKSGDTAAFYDTVTFPAFPAGMSVIFNSPVDIDENSGKLQVRVETNGSKTSRSGRYYLSLQAYGDSGSGVYDQKIDMSTLGANYAPRYTVVTDSRGAIATWEGLSSNYEYEVYLQQISNTGAARRSGSSYTDGYGGSTTGAEGTLGRRMVVDAQGYCYEYDETVLGAFGINYSDYNQDGLLPSQGVPTEWSDAAKLAYTGGRSWNTPLSGSTRIKFNKPPRASLPTVWYDESRLTVDGEDKYILVDKTMDATAANFNIKINAWDPDGASESSPVTIYANIGGTMKMENGKPIFNGGVTNTKTLTSIATTKAEAEAAAVELTFSGQQLSAGVYDKLTVVITDGQLTQEIYPEGLRVVANQVYPSVSITGGAGTRKVEQGRPWNTGVNSYTLETSLGAKTDEIARRDQLRPLRLQIMKAEYLARYGSYSEVGIISAIRGSNSLHAYALSLLTKEEKEATGTVYYDSNTGKLTENGMRLAIDKEPLNTVTYFSVTQASYNSVDMTGVTQEKQRRYTEQVGGSTVYWVEQGYALAHDLCPWVKLEDGIPVVRGTLGETYDVRVVGSFGQNTYPLTNRFKVMQGPSVRLESARLAAWFEVDKFEYLSVAGENEDANVTVEMINQKARDEGVTNLEQTTNTDDKAYRLEKETIDGVETGRIRYFIYKLGDSRLSVGKDYFVGNLVVDTGVYDTLNRVGVFLTTNKDMNPNTYPGDLTQAGLVTWMGDQNAPPVSAGTYTYTSTGLSASKTYYVWTCYVTDGVEKAVYNKDCVMVTTSKDVQSSIYTFDIANMTIREAGYAIGGDYTIQVGAIRLGDYTPQAKIDVRAKYFKADEYGHILNGNGEIWDGVTMSGAEGPQEVSENNSKLKLTTTSMYFKGANVAGGVVDTESATKSAPTELRFTPKPPSPQNDEYHMVVRLYLELDLDAKNPDGTEYTKGYNYLATSGRTMDIFVLDQYAPVTTYKVGVVNPPEGQPGHMPVKNDVPGRSPYYEYELSGQRVGYTSADTFEFAYENIGSGDLSNIIVEIYDKSGNKLSNDFFLTQQPIPGSLPYVENGEKPTGTAAVMAVTGLEDGVHECWVRLRDEKTEEKDYVWIHLIQIVGQSTLTGRIYATQEMPANERQFTGEADVYLYPMGTTYDQGTATFSEPWAYHATTNKFGGQYTIEHILNNRSYYVVVERDGFLTYNGVQKQAFEVGGTSVRMEFNLRMLAGDLTGMSIDEEMLAQELAPAGGDGIVNEMDEAILTRCYNLTYVLGSTEPPKTMLEYLIRRCDFNLDGAVNGLDRTALYNNMFKTSDDYKYKVTQPIIK